MDVSIHAPVKGATEIYSQIVTVAGFNSRTRKGCDESKQPSFFGFGRFNSRTRKGCDENPPSVCWIANRFQFTHP